MHATQDFQNNKAGTAGVAGIKLRNSSSRPAQATVLNTFIEDDSGMGWLPSGPGPRRSGIPLRLLQLFLIRIDNCTNHCAEAFLKLQASGGIVHFNTFTLASYQAGFP